MKTNGWYWDEESQRWTVNRGKFIVTVKLPKDHVPELGATLFGVQINETRAKLHGLCKHSSAYRKKETSPYEFQ